MGVSYAETVTVSLTDCLDSGSYHGPRWRMESGDLFIPVDSIEEEATLTCDAKGTPTPQYRCIDLISEHLVFDRKVVLQKLL